MRSKTLHVLCVVVVLASMLAACAAPATPSAAPAAEKPAAAATEAPAAEAPAEAAPAAEKPAAEAPAVEEPAVAQGGELKVGLDSDIAAVDPAFAYDSATDPVVMQITEGLMKFGESGEPLPCLAESIENPDPQTYIIKLRQGVTFSDGTPMTVEDVLFSLERTRAPETASYVGWMLGNVDKIEKVDDSSLKITLLAPDATFKYALGTAAGHVISKAYYEAHKDTFGKPEGGLLGTGAYKFVSWTTGSEIVLEKNENYWDKASGGPYMDRIIYKILPEATTRIAALQTGELDLILYSIPGDQIPVAQKIDKINLTLTNSFNIDAAEFNTQRAPFDNVKLRQALNYAMDKPAVTKALLGDTAMPAKATAVMPSLWSFEKEKFQAAFDALPAYEKDLEKAKALLAESGVKPEDVNGKVIKVDDHPVRVGIALALQAAAAELGLQLEVLKVTPQELMTLTFGAARDYDIAVQNWSADFPDPSGNLVPLFHSKNTGDGGANYGNYSNPEVDKLLDEQNVATDNAVRADLMIKAQEIIANDSPWIFVDYTLIPLAMSKDLTGYTMVANWFWDASMKNIKRVK